MFFRSPCPADREMLLVRPLFFWLASYVTGVAVFRGGLKNGNSFVVARTL
jgi:hypothetical protein